MLLGVLSSIDNGYHRLNITVQNRTVSVVTSTVYVISVSICRLKSKAVRKIILKRLCSLKFRLSCFYKGIAFSLPVHICNYSVAYKTNYNFAIFVLK